MVGLTVDIYRVTLTRTSTGMCSGVSHTEEETTTSTSIVIDGLEENSIYTVTISAMNNEFNAVRSTSGPNYHYTRSRYVHMFTCIVVGGYLLYFLSNISLFSGSGRGKVLNIPCSPTRWLIKSGTFISEINKLN